jgi:uncharacterized protein (DUF952 family)
MDQDIRFNQNHFYKIVKPENFRPENSFDCISLTDLDQKSGFIHLSKHDQVDSVLQKFFMGAPEVLIFALDPAVLHANGSTIVEEQNKQGGSFYPHVYGKQEIPLTAVCGIYKVQCDNQTDQWHISLVQML